MLLFMFQFDDDMDIRFKVPKKMSFRPRGRLNNKLYEFEIVDKKHFSFRVKRKSTGAIL